MDIEEKIKEIVKETIKYKFKLYNEEGKQIGYGFKLSYLPEKGDILKYDEKKYEVLYRESYIGYGLYDEDKDIMIIVKEIK